MTESQFLVDAKELLANGWCQGTFARDTDGKPCPTFDAQAVSFDLAGAITRASGSVQRARPILDLLVGCITVGLPEWNDHASYDEVVAFLNETLATVRAKEVLV